MQLEKQMADFLAGKVFAVAGASTNRQKYGNKVLRCYQQHSYQVIPVNPNEKKVEGVTTVASLLDIAPPPHGLSIITPPVVTERIVEEAIQAGVKHIWMQPGAESPKAIQDCKTAGINTIHSGPCLLVVLGYRETA